MVDTIDKYHVRWDFIGLSTDEKPTPETSEKVVSGSTFYCSDTSKLYVWYDGNWWERFVTGSVYTLPVASHNVLGGVKIGDNLSIDADGVLSADAAAGAIKGVEVNGVLIIPDEEGVVDIEIADPPEVSVKSISVNDTPVPPDSQGNVNIETPEIDTATDETSGVIKLNSAQSINVDADGHLTVGGRLGQYPNGGVYYPDTIEPTVVKTSSFMMTDGAKNLSLGSRQFGIMAGANLTCKSTAAGSTQYRLSNTQVNRFACFAGKNGRLAIDQTDASTNGTALITDISFANGDPISAYFGPTESDNDIIITVDRTVNPSAATTKLRIYGTSTNNDAIVVGQGCGASGGKAISLGQSCFAGGNQCIAFGNSSISTANNSVAFGHTHLVNKQFCFAAGQGHDFTNASNGAGAVGIASTLSSDTVFAVGNGTFSGVGDTIRSNAFEVTKDGGIILKSSGGNRFKITVDDSGNLTTSPIT